VGMVVSDKMDKTVVVSVEHMTRHRLYQKTMRRTKRYLAHDDRLEARIGDLVRIVETRPLSRHKRWRVAEILQKGEGAEVAPREIDREYIGQRRQRAKAEEAAQATAPTPVEETWEEAAPVGAAASEEPAVATVEEPAPVEAPAQAEAPPS